MKRSKHAKIVATLGPASNDKATIRALFEAGADVFRLNFSHGTQADHHQRIEWIREIEGELQRPIGVLLDLQGPKLRIGSFAGGPVTLEEGQTFLLDMDADRQGCAERVALPHPEIFAALHAGTDLLLDDGKLRLRVEASGPDFARTTVIAGGQLSDRKGVNVPGVVLPISALTPKDRADLAFGLTLQVDWVALSFVQRPEDIIELRDLVAGQAGIVAKLEKPAAIASLAAIVDATDAVMVARGDLGVELPAEQVPRVQKEIVRACRDAGKPVIVATQMLESMVNAPVPTRAEASDVATAIYDGADAVMLSAESASGRYPREAVAMMDRVIKEVEADPHYRILMDTSSRTPQATVADAICSSLRESASVLPLAAMVTYTRSGYTCLRAARGRPEAPMLGITPEIGVARQLALVWGVHSIHAQDAPIDVPHIIAIARDAALREGFARPGSVIAVAAGMPFGVPGTTNLLHLAQI